MIVSVLVMHEFHAPIHREPVGVNIKETHEDAYHEPAIVKIFVFFYLFYNHHFAVGRSHDNIVGVVVREISDGTSVKICGYTIYSSRSKQEQPEWYFGVKRLP